MVADSCYTVTVDGAAIAAGPICVDESGILAFEYEGPDLAVVCFSPAGGDSFHVCPGECGVRPQEESSGALPDSTHGVHDAPREPGVGDDAPPDARG